MSAPRRLAQVLAARATLLFEVAGAYRCAGLRGRAAFGTLTDFSAVVQVGDERVHRHPNNVGGSTIRLRVRITPFVGAAFRFDPMQPSPWRPVFRSRLRGRA